MLRGDGKRVGVWLSVPGSYLLVADMDGVKMVSVDGSADDKSLYVAAAGRPFSSNVVALAYDSASQTAYYSDVAWSVYTLESTDVTFVENILLPKYRLCFLFLNVYYVVYFFLSFFLSLFCIYYAYCYGRPA